MRKFWARVKSTDISHDQEPKRYKAGRDHDAERKVRSTVPEREEKLDPEHTEALEGRDRLAWSLYEQEKYDEAEKYFREIIPVYEANQGPKHINTLESKRGLGYSLHGQGKYDEAKKYFREIIPVYEANQGLKHIDTLDSKRGLGLSLYEQGKYDEAEKYFREIIPVYEANQGLKHINTLNGKRGLGWSLLEQGKYDEAEKYFREIIPVYEANQGLKHIDTLDSKRGLGWSLYGQGRYEEAEKYFREIIPVYEANQGPKYIDTLDSKRGLGWSLHGQGRYKEAKRHFREAGVEMPAPTAAQHPGDVITSDSSRSLSKSVSEQQKPANPAGNEADNRAKSALEEAGNSAGTDRNRRIVPTTESLSQKSHAGSPIKIGDRRLPRDATMTPASIAREHEELLSANDIDTLDPKRLLSKSSPQQEKRASIDVISLHGDDNDTKMNRDRQELSRRGDSKTLSHIPIDGGYKQLTDQLNVFFDRNGNEDLFYNDLEISKLASLLRHLDPRWSKCPRTYVVLRWMNSIYLFDGLTASGFSDYSFPATEKSLPQLLSPSQKSEFVKTQRMILTRSLDLEKGQHCYFDKENSLPLQKQRILGRGGFGQVDEVLSTISYFTYARKRVIRRATPELLQLFVAELEIIKRLRHKHVVEFIGSYSDSKYLGLLMLPVAEMDLSTYLKRPDIESHLNELRTFFGCLATALEFLHSQRIRHKDIKPENILIHRGNVLLTDFGLSYDFSDGQRSTTVGMVNALTFRYCAPEVAEHEPRNTSSDIWSLGVVFLEMLVVLKGLTREYMDEYYEKHGSGRPYVRLNPNGTAEFIATLRTMGNKSDNEPFTWVEAMLRRQANQRLTAAQLVTTINTPDNLDGGSRRFCGLCCTPDDDFSDFSD